MTASVYDRAWSRYLAGESFIAAFRSEWRKRQ